MCVCISSVGGTSLLAACVLCICGIPVYVRLALSQSYESPECGKCSAFLLSSNSHGRTYKNIDYRPREESSQLIWLQVVGEGGGDGQVQAGREEEREVTEARDKVDWQDEAHQDTVNILWV